MASRKDYELQRKNFENDMKKAGVPSKQEWLKQQQKLSTTEKKLDQVVEMMVKLDTRLRSMNEEINDLKKEKKKEEKKIPY